MTISIEEYMQALNGKTTDYFNLVNIDFSSERQEMVAKFCSWLQNHPYVTHLAFADYFRGGHKGVFLGRINPLYLIQIFNAIQNNPRIRHVELRNCHLEELTDIEANAAIGNCLASKPVVKITGNRDTRAEISPALLLPIARGATTNLELGFIYWRGGEEAFFNALTAQKHKVFERIALVNNTANRCLPEQLAQLCSLKVSILDLSDNELILNYLSSYGEWENIIAQIQANDNLHELNLRNTYRTPFRRESILLLQEIKPLLFKWIQDTRLIRLDISMNGWDEALIITLRASATQRSPALPKLKLLCCEDDYEVDVYGLEDDKSDSSPETAVTAASSAAAAEDQEMLAPKHAPSPSLPLYQLFSTTAGTTPESSRSSLSGALEESLQTNTIPSHSCSRST